MRPAAAVAITLAGRLREVGINPTAQRLRIAKALFEQGGHPSAAEILARVNTGGRQACRATVYNTLDLFVDRGLVREIAVGFGKSFYESNTVPHHHFYNVDTGELRDIPPDALAFETLPPLPENTQAEGVSVVIRVRDARSV